MLQLVFAVILASTRPLPNAALAERMIHGPELIGIVHWGLNTYTDREWGYGDENPQWLNPKNFDAEQIVNACKAGGIGGLVIVAKHHDGFCLWPTKTTEHNITKSPFRNGKGDYVREMERACRKAGIKFGVYVSPWDRNSSVYATDKYVKLYHEQLKELLGGAYGEVFEMWFDGANGGDGYYGGAREKRKIGEHYYRFDEIFKFIRAFQPKVCFFSGEPTAEFRWPGNERGILDVECRATSPDEKKLNYKQWAHCGVHEGVAFKVPEADFPMRPGWFYHAKEDGKTKNSAYLMQRYLNTVGNGGTMDLGIAPNKDGVLTEEDVKVLKGLGDFIKIFFAKEVKGEEPFNLVVMREDFRKGELVDEWEFLADGQAVLKGKSIGTKRIRVLDAPIKAKKCELKVLKSAGKAKTAFKRYYVDPELVKLVMSATTTSGETDTAIWMTKGN